MSTPCPDHPCDNCPTCRLGTCCLSVDGSIGEAPTLSDDLLAAFTGPRLMASLLYRTDRLTAEPDNDAEAALPRGLIAGSSRSLPPPSPADDLLFRLARSDQHSMTEVFR